jgi:hypothetical protein
MQPWPNAVRYRPAMHRAVLRPSWVAHRTTRALIVPVAVIAWLVLAPGLAVAAPANSSAAGTPTTSASPGSTTPSSQNPTAPPASQTPIMPPPRPLRVISILPHQGRTILGDAHFRIRFSAPLAARQTVAVRLVPALAGRWRQIGADTLGFTPASAFAPGQRVRLIVPAGIRAADGAVLKRPVRFRYRVGQPSPVRLVQLLAGLRYLPVHFVSRNNPRQRDTAGQLQALYSPPHGRFVFGRGWPSPLHQLWAHDRAVVIRGALMAFASQHGLPMSGVPSPRLWSALRAAVRRDQANRSGYSYAIASEAIPETLTVYHNGAVVVRTLANTGIPAAPTAQGTFPVYERLRSQVMRGVNPDGAPYADFVQWVAYFNGGDAVHYMPRAFYGYPQSLGCVELPYAAAQRAWGYLTYGTLVTVD